MLKNLLLFTVAAALLSSCATAPFQEGRRIEPKGSFVARSFEQEGKKVDSFAVIRSLKQNSKAKDSAAKAEGFLYASMIAGGAGGFLLGYQLFSSSESKGTGIGIGAGLVALALIGGAIADHALLEGVEFYNQQLDTKKRKRSSSINLSPTYHYGFGGPALELSGRF